MGEAARTIRGYTLQERIGQGGFGAVYRAHQRGVDRDVAIKVILPQYANQPDFIRRFESEAHTIARLEHPHITPLIDYWRDPDGAYLVMRYLRGGSVRDALQQDGPYELIAIVQCLDQIASALDFAHRNHVIHRDIKPGNILLDEDGNAYLADFGIAKDLHGLADGMTGAEAVVGSLDYISPEQARSEPVTPRTDIYSLGVTLYEMIVGQHPFKEASSVERLYKHINDPLPEIINLPDNISDDINEIIQKATAKDPSRRYPDVLALAVAFRKAAGQKDRSAENLVEQLTLREQEILNLIAKGMSNREIADELVITVGTVKWHIRQVYGKLGVRSRVQAIVRARELNLIVSGDTTADVPSIISEGIPSVSLPEPENPYKGLHAFQTSDARDFFGREELTQKLISDMQTTAPYHRFLAVIGPSGSGKSSLVRAGLVPALWRGALPGSEKWFVVDMIPGTHPLDKLETALIRVAANQAGNLHDQLQRDGRSLVRVADIILPGDDTELVIVVDQFEEVFTLVEDESVRQHFLDLLRTAVSEPRSRVRVIVTLRADYYDRPLMYPEFGEMVRSRMETVLPLSAKGLERAIRGPAERVGVIYEQGLVEQIVSEMNYQAGALPLLQYALTELFDQREGRLLTQKAYQNIGGAVGALANRADEIYVSLTAEGKELAQQMFMRLVTLGEGAEDTRRRATQAELLSLTENTDLMEEIIDQFAAYRLLSLDHDPETRQPTVEVAHEAILREWELLRGWINDSRTELRLQRQLAGLVADWQRGGQDASYLLRGARLTQFESWASATSLTLTPREKEFLKVSTQARTEREAVEQARQEREIALEKRARRIFQWLTVVLLFAALGGVGLSVFAFDREQQAQAARDSESAARAEAEASLRRTNAQRLGLESTSLAQTNGEADLIGLLAVRSINTQHTPQGDFAVQQAIQRQFPKHVITTGSPAGNNALALSPNGELLAIAGKNGVVTIVSTQTYSVVKELSAADVGIDSITFVGDNKTVAVGQWPAIYVFDIETGEIIFMRDTSEDRFSKSIAYVPEGNILALGSNVADILLLDASTWEEIGRLETPGGAWGMGVSPDGRYLLTAQTGGYMVRMWDMTTFSEVATFNHPVYTYQPRFSPDGKLIAVVTGAGELYIWAVDQPDAPLHQIEAHSSGTNGIAFTSDGKTIITSSDDTLIKFWGVETGLPAGPALQQPGQQGGLVLSHDGMEIYTAGQGPTVRVWETVFDNPVPHIPSERHWYHQAFSPDGQMVASVRLNELRITDLVTGDVFLYEHDTMLNPVAYSHDGQYVLAGTIPTGGEVGEVFLMDVSEKRIIRNFDWEGWLVIDVAFSNDNQWVAASGFSDFIIWNMHTGERMFTKQTATTSPIMVTFDISPDNHYLIISSGWGEKAELVDLETGEVIWETSLLPHESGVAFSPDGQYFVIGDGSHLVRMWETETQTHVLDFVGHHRGITAVDFSPDGKWLITGSEDSTARIWNVVTGEEVRRFEAGSVAHVLFSPDDKHILIDDAINVTIWNADIADDVAYLCDHITRDFTKEERDIYEIKTDEPTCPKFAS